MDEKFFVSYRKVAMETDEVLISILIPYNKQVSFCISSVCACVCMCVCARGRCLSVVTIFIAIPYLYIIPVRAHTGLQAS